MTQRSCLGYVKSVCSRHAISTVDTTSASPLEPAGAVAQTLYRQPLPMVITRMVVTRIIMIICLSASRSQASKYGELPPYFGRDEKIQEKCPIYL